MYDKIIHVDFPLRGFLPKQMETLEACNNKSYVLYSGAFRAGKTLLLVHAAIKTCLENPNCKGLIGSLTYPQLNSVVFKLFLEELNKYQLAITKSGIDLKLATKILHSNGKMEVEFFNGSLVYFRSCDAERKLSGYTLDFAGLDEPVDIDESIFTQLMGRISGTGNLKNKYILLTTNPADEMHWIYKYFFLMKDDDFKTIETTTYDNRLLPDYSKYIKRLEKSYDKDWILRYLNGKWGMFEGAIYKEFNPSIHMTDCKDIPVKYYIAGVDWGLRDPYCMLVGGITEDNRLIIKEEIYGNNKSSHEFAKIISEKHKEYHFNKVYCDPAAADLILQAYNRGVPIGENRNGIIKSYADNDIQSGIARMQSLFKGKKILIDSSCFNFNNEHRAYRYKTGSDKPIDINNHTCDAARYLTTDFDPEGSDIFFEGIYYDYRKWD